MENLSLTINDWEIEYNKLLSNFKDNGDILFFSNNIVPYMYDYNFIYINKKIITDNEIKVILKYNYKKVTFPFDYTPSKEIEESFLKNGFVMHKLICFKYKNKIDFKEINNTKLVKINNNEDFENLLRFNLKEDILISEKYASDKSRFYKYIYDNNLLQLFSLYLNQNLVANLEIFKHNNIIKIEDVLVDKIYRNMGFGSNLISRVINSLNFEESIIYLLSYEEDNLSSFYKNLGFEPVAFQYVFLNTN